MVKLTKKEEAAIDLFIEPHTKDPNVVGIILTGSHVHSEPHKHSDLDIHIVLKKSKTRERGNRWILGQEVEYFINPIKQIGEYFKDEAKPHNTPSTAHMFANCIVLYKKGNQLDSLIKKAKQIVKKDHRKLKTEEAELAKYELDDLEKDLEDMVETGNEAGFMAIFTDILQACIKHFYRVKRKPRAKSKRLLEDLKKLDKRFARLYEDAVFAPDLESKREKAIKLINYTEKLLGGKRAKNWKLKSKTTV